VMHKESNIVHDRQTHWVCRDKAHSRYTVYVVGVTHSVSDSSYPLTEGGRSIAIARCDYLAKRKL